MFGLIALLVFLWFAWAAFEEYGFFKGLICVFVLYPLAFFGVIVFVAFLIHAFAALGGA